MKFRGPIFLSLIGTLFLIGAYLPQTRSTEKEAVLIQTILNGLNSLHYQPKNIDDTFSKELYDLYLDRIDGGRRWLTQEDVALFEPYKFQLDDAAHQGTYEFFDLSVERLNAAVEKTQTYYRDFLSKPVDLSKGADYEINNEDKSFAKNDEALKAYWEKNLTYEVVTRVAEALEKQEKKEDSEEAPKTVTELEAEARADVLKLYDRWYERLNKRKRTDYLSSYLNVVTNVFDPHTGYFEPIDKENFDIRMSGRLEGIGARLQSDGDYTKVSSIVVGGPAWKQKDLEENDLITKVTQPGEEPVDTKGMVLDDVVSMIRGDKGTDVILTVEKVDGTVMDVRITRDVVIIEEGRARSLILDKTVQEDKIGYIYLPSFYADFEDPNGRACAKDVASEIEKLKAEGTKGIILDLRDNGGGSLRDVVKMSGLFIEEGPIVQVKSRGRKPTVLDDTDPSVQWDGHLIVMVNSFSASASEILAAALQDYGRAVIIGTPTFGKGTVQRFIDLDRALPGNSDIKPLGQVKLTMQKFYRVNGGSTQLKGVVPDIILPDNYSYIEVGEKEHDYPMEWSEIDAVDYSQNVAMPNITTLAANSEQRVAANETFQKINENALRLKGIRETTTIPLSLEDYRAYEIEQEAIAKKYDGMFDPVILPNVTNLAIDMPAFENDESKKARNDDWVESVSKDVYIQEAINIMHDMMK